MKKVLLVLALVASNVASAQVQPEDIFGGILDIIQDQINKDKNKVDYGPGVILKDIGNNRIALGRIRLDDSESIGSFTLPKCNQSPNAPVSALRFQVSGSDAYVRRVRITYQNGDMENVSVDEVYDSGTPSDWYQVDTGKRCVQSITVRGGPVTIIDGFDNGGFGGGFELGPIKGFKKGPQFPPSGHPGWGGPQPGPHFPPGGGPGWHPGNPGPGNPGWGGPKPQPKPQPTVLTFIGLKADSNGF